METWQLILLIAVIILAIGVIIGLWLGQRRLFGPAHRSIEAERRRLSARERSVDRGERELHDRRSQLDRQATRMAQEAMRGADDPPHLHVVSSS